MKEFKELAQSLLDKNQPGTFNQAIMDFGALICKPQNPLCDACPFADSCVALQKNNIKELPVKEKKLKVKKRFFNYLVVKTVDDKTIFSQRSDKGIWQGLYQFPLIETDEMITKEQLVSSKEFCILFPEETTISLFNQKEIVHKLSHQHLYTQFWIIETKQHKAAEIPWETIHSYPVPVLIANFLTDFRFEK